MTTGDLPPSTPPTPETIEAVTPGGAMPLAQRAVRGGLWVAAASYWSIGFGFAANILLTRLLTPDVYGEYALATFFATLFQLRTKVGLSYAYAQERAVTGAAAGTVFTLDVLLGIGGLIVGAAAAPLLLAFGYSWPVVAMMLTLLALSLGESFFGVFVTTLEKELLFKPGQRDQQRHPAPLLPAGLLPGLDGARFAQPDRAVCQLLAAQLPLLRRLYLAADALADRPALAV